MLVLVDQDGVLADFDRGFNLAWQEKFPDRAVVELALRRHFYLRDDYPEEHRAEIKQLQASAGFIVGLPPLPGALAALEAMLGAGHDVRICTSPLSRFTNCVGEKFQWVDDHLGAEWVGRIVLTKDKTLVRGDVLIDDKPEVTGSLVPTWEHLVFEAPYNSAATARRINWGNWQQVLGQVELDQARQRHAGSPADPRPGAE
jgi:5'-nucleotidase